MEFKLFFSLTVLICLWQLIYGDMHVAISELEELVKLEKTLAEKLENYLILEKGRLERLKVFVQSVRDSNKTRKQLHGNSKDNQDHSITDSKHLSAGWTKMERLLKEDFSKGELRIYICVLIV